MFNFPVPEIEAGSVLPLAVVALTGLLVLLVEMFRPKHDNRLLVILSLLGLGAAGALIFQQIPEESFDTAAGMIYHDAFGSALQLLLIGCTAITILFSDRYLRQKRVPFGEFYPLVLWSSTGAMMMVATTNLMMIFVGLEILSISLYVMAGMSREEEKSEEAAMKYFLLGAFASGFLLYGIALIYGALGSLDMLGISLAWAENHSDARMLLTGGVGMMLVGLSFKAGFVPFHQWTPDVYQGAPTNVTAFMATASKIAAIGALWRLLFAAAPMSAVWVPVLGAVAILTMLFGNILALAQTDVKRVLAYSSISHAGYVLVDLVATGKMFRIGNGTVCFYLLSYSLMTLGAFAIVTMFAKSGREGTTFSDLNGLWRRSPVAASLLALFMLSLIGLPPFAGFFGKAFIFGDAIQAGLTPLAIVLAVSSVISVAYYLRIALAAFTPSKDDVEARTTAYGGTVATAATVCAVGVIAVTVFYAPLMRSLKLDPTQARFAAKSPNMAAAKGIKLPARGPAKP
ncbi:MAG TPA: NADH-quinone oxidoreductase subunit N [Fimbriimonas sp.]|nr:NADH-quinone oxidoreductase subunit N [Fimbriimonas sp.]